MKFVNPTFLYALVAVVIPIIIHLFNFRKYKTIYFTNVRFLKEVKQQTQAKSQLKHLLVLASRILAISLLVLAFAQPFIPTQQQKNIFNQNAISVFADNSYSMNAVSENGNLIDVAKNAAINISNSYKATDKFQLLTNDFEGKHQRLVNKDQYNEYIDNISTSPSIKTLSQIIERQQNALSESENSNKSIFIISDFQQIICDIDQLKNDSTTTVNLVPLIAEKNDNIYIDSCWFETPIRRIDQQEKLHVRIKNNSEKNATDVPLKLFVNEQQKAISSFNINAGETIDSTLYFTNTESGFQLCRIEITDYPITYDDVFYLSFDISPSVNVLCIFQNDTNPNIQSLFNDDEFVFLRQQSIRQLDYSLLKEQHLIILSEIDKISSGLMQEIIEFTQNGGSLVLLPSITGDFNTYNQLLSNINANEFGKLDTTTIRVSEINLEDYFYDDVFEELPKNINLPTITKHFNFNATSNSLTKTSLLTLQNNDDLLCRYSFGKGKVYIFSSSLGKNTGNFASHSLFVPTFYKIAINSIPQNKLYYTIGKDFQFELKAIKNNSADQTISIKNNMGDEEFIPEIRKTNNGISIIVHDQIKNGGNHLVKDNNEIIHAVSFNYDRNESNLNVNSIETLQEMINDNGLNNYQIIESSTSTIANDLSNINNGKQLWKYCVILALVFLGIETLLLKFWK